MGGEVKLWPAKLLHLCNKADMANQIVVDLSGAKVQSDVFARLLDALGAPVWHGQNLDALWESIGYGENGLIAPPYVVHLTNVMELSTESRALLFKIADLFKEAKDVEARDVACFVHELSHES
jgi:RNAse (barnase) inhibitor barstar